MKKILLLIFSVVILFSSCTKSSPTQIDPSEEFGGITFGMTKDEIISFLGKEPDSILELDSYDIDFYDILYQSEEHFNVSNIDVLYHLNKDDDTLHSVIYDLSYDESEQEQFANDYAIIKEELLRRYPEEIWIDSHDITIGNDTILKIYTENRRVVFHSINDYLKMSIFIDEYEPIEDASQTQINPAEDFDGITFGMALDEVVEFYGRQPDYIVDIIPIITYENETFFNIRSADVSYGFTEYSRELNSISVLYSYSKDNEDNSFQTDYDSIKEELLKRYSESANSVDETDNELTISTDDRHVTLSKSTNDEPTIILMISDI